MELDLQQLCDKVCSIARDAGVYLHSQQLALGADEVEEKGVHNLVSRVDKTTEQQLVDALSALLPAAGFIAEEGTSTKRGECYNWIVDPLDGTTNYIHKLPLYAVSIALQAKDEIVLGVVYEPNIEECFYTWKHAPSFLNGKVIKVADNDDLDNALLATGFPYYDYSRLDAYLALFKYLMQNSRGVRRLGSAAVDLAYTACGRYDAFYEYGLSPWDVAAGMLLVQNAGGINMDFKGGQDVIFGKEIVSGNRAVSGLLLSKIQALFL